MKVFLNSKRNAGVYMDTTVESSDPIVVTRNNKDAVYAALRRPDLYEQESDEEFWRHGTHEHNFSSKFWRHRNHEHKISSKFWCHYSRLAMSLCGDLFMNLISIDLC